MRRKKKIKPRIRSLEIRKPVPKKPEKEITPKPVYSRKKKKQEDIEEERI